jgi:hypothetical protein
MAWNSSKQTAYLKYKFIRLVAFSCIQQPKRIQSLTISNLWSYKCQQSSASNRKPQFMAQNSDTQKASVSSKDSLSCLHLASFKSPRKSKASNRPYYTNGRKRYTHIWLMGRPDPCVGRISETFRRDGIQYGHIIIFGRLGDCARSINFE